MDLQGKEGKQIQLISRYRVSQESNMGVGPMMACQQQYNALVESNLIQVNPKKTFLEDIKKIIVAWRKSNENNKVILIINANKDVNTGGPLDKFISKLGLIDAIG